MYSSWIQSTETYNNQPNNRTIMRFLIAIIAAVALATVVTAAPREAEETFITIRDKLSDEYLFDLDLMDDTRIAELSQMVAEKLGTEDKVTLYYNDKQLDEKRDLQSYKIPLMSSVHVEYDY